METNKAKEKEEKTEALPLRLKWKKKAKKNVPPPLDPPPLAGRMKA